MYQTQCPQCSKTSGKNSNSNLYRINPSAVKVIKSGKSSTHDLTSTEEVAEAGRY